MFFAQAYIQETQINLYLHQFSSLVAGESGERKTFIDSSIEDARSILDGKKNVFSIPNDRFFLVTFLVDHCSKILNSKKSEKDIYSEIISCFKSELV